LCLYNLHLEYELITHIITKDIISKNKHIKLIFLVKEAVLSRFAHFNITIGVSMKPFINSVLVKVFKTFLVMFFTGKRLLNFSKTVRATKNL
jgi:hypothetical protein